MFQSQLKMHNIPSLSLLLFLVVFALSNFASLAYVPPVIRSGTHCSPSAIGSCGPRSRFLPKTPPRTPVGFDALTMSSERNDNGTLSLRTRLRNLTGFSFTALRATLRATTGFSLTAVRVAVGATTSKFVNGVVSTLVGIFPTWFRYFLQPLLVMYYTPLMLVRSMVGPTKTFWKDERATHEAFVDGWKQAVDAAEQAQKGGYWPVHVDQETGAIEMVLPPDPDDASVDVVDAVAESVEVAMSKEGQ